MKFALPIAAITIAMLSACSTTPTADTSAAPTTTAAAAPAAAPAPAAKPAPKPKAPWATEMSIKDPNHILSKRSVYFDFDKYEVKLDYLPIVEAHAKYLKMFKDQKAMIQGNTDERGSREYNLALGQKRADAVKKVMTSLGVSDSQIETVSLGEDKPKATGHDEAAWTENRRADILYKGEY